MGRSGEVWRRNLVCPNVPAKLYYYKPTMTANTFLAPTDDNVQDESIET